MGLPVKGKTLRVQLDTHSSASDVSQEVGCKILGEIEDTGSIKVIGFVTGNEDERRCRVHYCGMSI